jgi:MFS family permease
MSLYQGSFLLGNSVGPTIGGFTAQYFSYRAPFFLYGALAFIVGIWMWIRLPDSRSNGEQRIVDRKDTPGLIESARRMLKVPGVVLVCLIGFLATYTRAGSRNMGLPLLGEEIGLTESQIGLAFTLVFLMVVLSLVVAGTLADRFGTKAIIVPSWLFSAFGLILVVKAPEYGIFLMGVGLYGLATGIGSPVPVAYIVNVVEEENQGMALGLFRTFNDFGMLLGPIIMGWLADWSSIGNGVLINAGLVILMAIIFFLLAPSRQRRAEAPVNGQG